VKKRTVAYCRVSSDHEDQLNSLQNQKQYWEEYIKNRDDLEYCGLYIDEGITGTSTLKRDGFNQMIRDAYAGKFDFIVTKEVSRFGRNIIDVLQYTRKLKEIGIGVYFESDNINTLDNDGELRLSIMATLAQEESRKISERVKWGHKRAMKNGVVFGANRTLGYDRDKVDYNIQLLIAV
jgi:DNA invertase Pin-like site-specific DNA recombinase